MRQWFIGQFGFLLLISTTADLASGQAGSEPSATALRPDPTSVTTMPRVTVIGQAEDRISGSSTLDSQVLQALPARNQTLTDALTVLPRVQIGEQERTSENAGEILPPLISISGARPYESYLAIDGVGINSLLDPLADNQNALDQVPGHPQRSFIHLDLIESVEIYDSNIPARYGRFVGGVIDARTRNPASDLGGRVTARTTQDTWTQFHVAADERSEFENSDSFSRQPDFEKFDGGLELDVPITAQSALLAAYKRVQSDLEFQHFGEAESERKLLETFFLKYAWTPSAPTTLELSTAYTPSEEDFFITDTRGSDFTIERGGAMFSALLSGDHGWLGYELTAAYLDNENSRTAPAEFFTWRNTPSRNWGEAVGVSRSREGGFGDIETGERSGQFKVDLLTETMQTGRLSQTVNFGGEYIWDYGEYDRQETAVVYSSATLDEAVICAPGDRACVSGEQYFANRNIYVAQDETAEIHSFAAYLEDQITLGPVTLRPGVRLSHNDFMDNTDLAHRLSGSWDLFDNGMTVLVAGYNRYYGETLLTYKLREAITPFVRESRELNGDTGQLSDWVFDRASTGARERYSRLDTPYSDEVSLGIVQALFGGTLELNYLERRHEDQFASERITEVVDGEERDFRILNNKGSSRYDSVKVVWERWWAKHYLNLNYTYSDQESSNESYDDTFDLEDLEEEVWYNGELTAKDRLPREDFYRKHAFTALYTGQLPGGFTFTGIANYLGRYEDIVFVRLDDEERTARGIPAEVNIFEQRNQPDYWLFDCRLDWQTRIYPAHVLKLSLEINNVFDRAPPVAGDDDLFALGRQVWFGATYSF